MRKILTDILIADAAVYERNLPTDSLKPQAQKYYLEIFSRHHINREQFIQSIKYYTSHPDIFDRTLGPVIDSLNTLEGSTHKGAAK